MFLKNIIKATKERSKSHKIVEQFIIMEYIYMNKLFFTTVRSVSFGWSISNSYSKHRYAPTVRLSVGARARPDPPGPRNVGRCVSRYRPTHFTFSLIFLHSFSVSLSPSLLLSCLCFAAR